MPDAVSPQKVSNIANIVEALKGEVQNVSLNLETGGFDVKDAKGKVVKTIEVKKAYDAAYVVNRSKKEEDVLSSGEFLKGLRVTSVKAAGLIEARLSETEEDLLKAVSRWSAAAPGAAKISLSIEVGRLQRELAILERRLRNAQYKYREVLPFTALRRLYSPMSNDDRVTPFNVYQIVQTHNQAAERAVPVSE
jgi:hypothetical protein